MELSDKVLKYIKKHNMTAAGGGILIALSGGADSVCLTLLLKELQEELDLKLMACHINHSLRGGESDGDEDFAREFCEKNNIPFIAVRVDVNSYANERRIGTEEAARLLRYETFDRISNEYGLDYVALAHNKNDQAETILFRFLRGSSSKGLSGMKPLRDGKYIRPLLVISRQEIEDYLESKNQDYRTDSTNLTVDFTRNKLRLELIPLLEKDYNPDIINNLTEIGELMAIDSEYLDKKAAELLESNSILKKDRIIIDGRLFREDPALTSRAVLKAYGALKGYTTDISKVHIEDILKLAKGETGKSLNIPGGVEVQNSYGDISLTDKDKSTESSEDYLEEVIVKIDLNKHESLTFGDYTVTVVSAENLTEIKDKNKSIVIKDAPIKSENSEEGNIDNKDVIYFNLDSNKVGDTLIFRTRRTGDRIRLKGINGRKSVKSLFIDRKIPRDEREKILIITNGRGDLAYIYPDIHSLDFRCDEDTDKIIGIEVTRNRK